MGLWQILYGIKPSDLNDYIKWFEEDHIAEKLARPGYDWAAHYQIDNEQSDISEVNDQKFIAMFGSHNTQAFYNPCPLQLKKFQDDLTKSMIAKRQSTQASILCEEWQINKFSDPADLSPVDAPWILIKTFDSISNDQLFNAWCCQCFMKEASKQPGFIRGRKFLGSDSVIKHTIIIEYEQPVELKSLSLQADFIDLTFNELATVWAKILWPS